MNDKNLTFKIMNQHIVVFYKNKQLFKVSNNINNTTNLLRLIER